MGKGAMANLLLLLLLFFLGNRKLKGKTASNGGVKGSSQRVCALSHHSKLVGGFSARDSVNKLRKGRK